MVQLFQADVHVYTHVHIPFDTHVDTHVCTDAQYMYRHVYGHDVALQDELVGNGWVRAMSLRDSTASNIMCRGQHCGIEDLVAMRAGVYTCMCARAHACVDMCMDMRVCT